MADADRVTQCNTSSTGCAGCDSLARTDALYDFFSSSRRNCQNPRLIIVITSKSTSKCERIHLGRSANRYRAIDSRVTLPPCVLASGRAHIRTGRRQNEGMS